VLPIPLPGAAGRAMRSGALRPASGSQARIGAVGFGEYVLRLRDELELARDL